MAALYVLSKSLFAFYVCKFGFVNSKLLACYLKFEVCFFQKWRVLLDEEGEIIFSPSLLNATLRSMID